MSLASQNDIRWTVGNCSEYYINEALHTEYTWERRIIRTTPRGSVPTTVISGAAVTGMGGMHCPKGNHTYHISKPKGPSCRHVRLLVQLPLVKSQSVDGLFVINQSSARTRDVAFEGFSSRVSAQRLRSVA